MGEAIPVSEAPDIAGNAPVKLAADKAVSAEPLSAGKVPDSLAIGKVPLVSWVALRAVKEAPLPDKGLSTVMFPVLSGVSMFVTLIVEAN